MLKAVAIAVLFGLSLLLWRAAYAHSCWAGAALLPLWAFVFLGIYYNRLERRRSVMLAILRDQSRLLGLMSGKTLPLLSALIVSSLSVAAVALHALLASPLQIAALLFMVAASTLAYSAILALLRPHIRALALPWYSAATATVIAAALFVIPYAVFEWSIVERPGYIRLGFSEAIAAALAPLPPREDWINQGVLAFHVLDSSKLWLAARFPGTPAPGALYAAHSALICLVTATSSVGAASFYDRHIDARTRRPGEGCDGPPDE